MMFEQFTSSIARLFSGTGSIAGAGFLVSKHHLLTCAHVVADALGIRRETVDKPSGKVSLDLPLVAAGKQYTAQVVVWEALRYDAAIGTDVGDVALLELDEALSATIRQAPLSQVAQPLDQSCWVFGFPRHHDAGVWSPGLLRAANASGWVQLEDKGESAYFVQPGFSGGPIWSETEQSIVGMVAAAERYDPKTPNKRRVAFMIPVKLLSEAWPALPIQQNQPIRQQQEQQPASHGGIRIGDQAQIGEVYTGGKREINTGGTCRGGVNTGGGNFSSGNFTISGGTFTGSQVGYNVNIEYLVQTIDALSPSSEKDKLKALVQQLHESLKNAPPAEREAAEIIAQLTDQLVAEASFDTPNRLKIKITAQGLKQAAQEMTSVREVVEQIVTFVLRMVG